MGAAIAVMALAAAACSKSKDENNETTVAGDVEGPAVVMPQEGADTDVVAQGKAVAVEEN